MSEERRWGKGTQDRVSGTDQDSPAFFSVERRIENERRRIEKTNGTCVARSNSRARTRQQELWENGISYV